MLPLPRRDLEAFTVRGCVFAALLSSTVCTLGCNAGGTGVITPPPPITVTVSSPANTVLVGNQLTFTARVANTTDAAVSWSVNGVAGGSTTVGTITSAGVYTAPADLPSPASVQVTATSHADPTKSGSASVTITSDIGLSLTPSAASVELGAVQPFQVNVTSNGHPDTSVRWSLSGGACPTTCGSVDSSGRFTAPQILPSPASTTLTAQSVADPSKQASATLLITSNFTLQLSAPSNVPVGTSTTIVATLTLVPNSNPSTLLFWSLSGPGCSGSSCGILSVVTTQTASGSSITNTATYTAPAIAPSPNTVTVTVTPQADPTKQAQATMGVQAGVSVTVSPPTYTLAANHRVTLAVQVTGTSNIGVNWSVNGAPGGNSVLGQICAFGSNPCQVVTSAAAPQVDYLAPGAIPLPNPVGVTAASAADSTKSASAQITVINHVLVSVQPATVTLAPLAVQPFQASVLGTTNQNVVWQLQGAACSIAGACGTVDASGNFTAPASALRPTRFKSQPLGPMTQRNPAPRM